MTHMQELNSSAASLPSYHSPVDVPPTYSTVIEDLKEPQQAYIAQQRDLLEHAGGKPASNIPGSSKRADCESQHHSGPTPTDTLDKAQVNREVGRLEGDDRRIGWAKIATLIVSTFLCLAVPAAIMVFADIAKHGTPSIPPPYPDKDTWCKCVRRLTSTQTVWIYFAIGLWGATAVADCILTHWWAVRARGRREAVNAIMGIICLMVGGVCYMIVSTRGRCPREFA